jgi:cytoskeletal protein RodZ
MPGLGEEFRAAREARHLSLSDVSEQIHIRSVYLQSIEAEDWSSIAAPVYVRGFVRTYARFLGLDQESAVERLTAMLGDAAPKPHDPVPVKPIRRRSTSGAGGASRAPSPWLWVGIVVAAFLVGVVGYKYYEYEQTGGSAVADVPSPAASAASGGGPGQRSTGGTGAATAVPAASPKADKIAQTLVVSVTQTSWLLVKIDGEQIVEGIYPAGTVKKFHGKSAIIRAGNAGGVELTVNGKKLGPLGDAGAVVDKTVQLAEE